MNYVSNPTPDSDDTLRVEMIKTGVSDPRGLFVWIGDEDTGVGHGTYLSAQDARALAHWLARWALRPGAEVTP
jgi:hypothetical protein